MSNAFLAFLARRRADLRQIANSTQGEYTAEDLASEAFILADEISKKRGSPFDFADETDQRTLMAWLNNEFVRYANKAFRHAVRIDRDWDSEEEGPSRSLAHSMSAPLKSDPQVLQQVSENDSEILSAIRRSYSQASAYFVLLVRMEWDFPALASTLALTLATLRDRIRAAGRISESQPSVFDGLEEVSQDFEPRPGSAPAGQEGPLFRLFAPATFRRELASRPG